VAQIDPARYSKTRNFINGSVTYLSPYISRGVISTRQVYESLLARGFRLYQMEKLVSELAWRDYFQQVWLAIGDRMFDDIRQPQEGVQHRLLPAALAHANTGIEAVDEGIRMLQQTGYMHNHLRMYTASIACNTGRAHWPMPAQWMYYHLLDGDLASNTCSWQWVAGSFSSKKYYCNQENINKYTGSRQGSSYLQKSYEELPMMGLPDALQETTDFSPTITLPACSLPALHGRGNILLYHHYHLDPQWRADEDADRILILEPSHFQRFPVSEKVIGFVQRLASNIPGIQLYVGEIDQLLEQLGMDRDEANQRMITREHPMVAHFPGQKDPREWLAPDVTGFFPSFFAFWKKASRFL
jgi:deoxyribodipyrimidine photo-lyase